MPAPTLMTGRDVVAGYVAAGYRIVTWPAIGDTKGPRDEGWTSRHYTLEDYQEGYRVGIMTGTEIEPGKHSTDVDIDWQPGSLIAQNLLPPTMFVFGRASKCVSHCFYTTDQPAVSFRYEDPIDKICLIELRGTTSKGEIGLQTMVPPSVWSKDNRREPLGFTRGSFGPASHHTLEALKRQVDYSAIGMLLAKHLGKNGFGHGPRLIWAGYLLRAGVPAEDLIRMGEAMSVYCNNTEVVDVRQSVESTARGLADTKQKIKGGPSLAKHLGPNGKKIIARINEWLGKDEDFIRVDGKVVKDSQENIRRAVWLLDITLSNDEFAERMLIQEADGPARHLEDSHLQELWLRIDRDLKFRPTYSFFEIVVNSLARENTFHPVRDYLDQLKWDGTPRIHAWLVTYGGAEDHDGPTKGDGDDSPTYLEAVSSIVLMAAVKRIREPGCKYDEMIVLESEQGLNKSSALRALCPNDAWFSDDLALNIGSKELIERSLGKWIIEASDLSGKRKTEIEQLKAMMSRQVDGPARMAYAHKSVERPRHFIIIGTTNSEAYLTDPTGARRFWPVRVKKFDVEGLKRDRDQLWAEAVVRVDRGESIRLPERLWQAAGEHQEARRETDPWEFTLHEALETIHASGDGKRRVTADALFNVLGIEIARRDRPAQMRVSQIMRRLGFQRTSVWDAEKKCTTAGYAENTPSSLATGGPS